MTEIEKKAEEYFNTNCEHSYADTIEELKEDVTKAYKDGYEQGQKNFDKKVTKLLNSYGVTFIDTNSIGGLIALHQLTLDLEKENEELQKAIAEKNSVIEKMKNCQNCKYYDATGLDNIQCSECFNGIDKWELAE